MSTSRLEAVNSPILETSQDLIQVSKENSPTTKKLTVINVARAIKTARSLSQRISEKIRESILKRDSKKFDLEGAHRNLKYRSIQEILDERAEDKILNVEKEDKNVLTEKITKSMVAQKLKYIRLMKLLKLEKAKANEYEQTTQALTYVINRDGELAQKMREALEMVGSENVEAIDKNALQKIMKELIVPDSEDVTRNSPRKNTEISGAGDQNSKHHAHSLADIHAPTRTSIRALSSKILDEETKKSDTSFNNTVRRRTTRGMSMIKPNTSPSTGGVIQSPVLSLIPNRSLLGRKREAMSLHKKISPMTEAIAKIRETLSKNKKPKELMTIKKILKLITSFTLDKLSVGRESAIVREQDMASFVYTSIFNIYSLAKLAESKFTAFMTSLKYYSAIHRVAVFMKLCALTNSSEDWTPDEGKQFLAGLDFLVTQQNIGLTIVNSEFEKRHYAPFVRAAEYARQFCERRHLTQELVELKKEMEQNKENDTGGHNRAGKIKVDLFLEMIVNLYRKYKLKMKEVIRPVFEACNFLNKTHLGIDEITVLVKHIEPEKFDLKRLEEIYVANEEFVSAECFGLSLDKFVVLALENDLFSIEKQRRFVNANDENEVQRNFKLLKEIWEKKKSKLEQIIDFNSKLYEPEIIEFWTKALESVDRDISTKENQNAISCLMKYRILTFEMNTTFSANVPLH